MIKKILPILLLLVGTGAGVGAGIALRPAPEEHVETEVHAAEEDEHAAEHEEKDPENPPAEKEYVKLNNQFVVPIVKDHRVTSLVVMSLSIEVPEGQKDAVFLREPKIRDAFLQVLFDHANVGGFDGAFTDANNLAVLRNSLKEIARKVLGKDQVSDVLIIEIARQDY